MASISETSYWINFFTTAGIPAGDSAHYAIMFSDNRITREMLLDLSKDYLTDMGITRLGDIIAILKHSKQVYNQEAKDKILKYTSLTSTSSSNSSSFSPIFTPRRSTAASRMVNQITSKHPEAVPMSQSPSPKPPAQQDPPKQKRKVSVFERLGADGVEETVTLSSNVLTASQSSVFSRLGGKSALKRAASSTSLEDNGSLPGKLDSLPYAGVLKSGGPTVAKRAHIKIPGANAQMRIPMRIKKTIKTVTVDEDRKASQIQRPEVSTTTAGVLSDFAKKETPSLKERLGSKTEVPSSTSTVSKLRTTASSKSGNSSRVRIHDRLGAKTDESSVVSSTGTIASKLRKEKQISGVAAAKKETGVFSRLGRKSVE